MHVMDYKHVLCKNEHTNGRKIRKPKMRYNIQWYCAAPEDGTTSGIAFEQ
jgi:hypothetical protein